ncbi:MAG: hypothetical protein LC632_03410 [Xanthomonadaceae bacterium]|nr:hypothetical protein [Xanthomonadaceae bacterium]
MQHPTTEQLLAVRDGVSTIEVRAHVDECATCRAELARFVRMRDALRALPDAEPPPGALDALLTARAAASRRARSRRYAGVAVAASVVMAVALLVVPHNRPAPPLIPVDTEVSLLAERSDELDRVLASVESHSGILDLRTAGTIVALEDRLATVDAHLRRVGTNEPRTTGELLRQRIALVNALVDVHAAQTQYSF